MFLSWSSWKSTKDTFWNIFPGQNLHNAIHYKFWYVYQMKAWLFYIRPTYSYFSR